MEFMDQYCVRRMPSKPKVEINTPEFLQRMKLILPYLSLSEIITIITLNKETLQTLLEIPDILIHLIKNYFLNPQSLNLDYFFRLFMIKRLQFDRLDLDKTSLSKTEQEVVLDALKKIENIPLVFNPERIPNKLNGWNIIQSGINLEMSPNTCPTILNVGIMDYIIEYCYLSAKVRKAFEDDQVALVAGCWMARKGGWKDVCSYAYIKIGLPGEKEILDPQRIKKIGFYYDPDSTGKFVEVKLSIRRKDISDMSALRSGAIKFEITAKNIVLERIYFCPVFDYQ